MGPLALKRREPGQVGNEAATAIFFKCRGSGSPSFLFSGAIRALPTQPFNCHFDNALMTYLVLARKYRPRDFRQLVGQEHVVRALSHALEQQRLHHAYLFTGTRGVGKTTLSRILAKALNCVGPDGQGSITATPCGVCPVCSAIDAGRFVDYIEMDAASNRGVDEMTALLDQAAYAPSSARFKVYMIDEVHMLSNHAFNAMLKTLEEPPPYLKFILATTDPQKVPVTVLSRCLQFNLKQMPPAQIVEHLGAVLQAEQISFEPNALRLLAQGAQGSMRDALSLTDQAIAYTAGALTENGVRTMLGAVDTGYLIQIADALLAEDAPALLAVADQMAAQSLSFANALQELALLFQRLALAQKVAAAVPDDLPEAEHIHRLAAVFPAQDVQLNYQIAISGRNDLALAPDEYAGFTMTLLRMLAFRPGCLESAGVNSETPAVPAARPVPHAAAVSKNAAVTKPAAAPLLAARPSATLVTPPAEKMVSSTETKLEAGAEVSSPVSAAENVPPFSFEGDWLTLVNQLELKGLARELARQSELVRVQAGVFHLRVVSAALAQAAQTEKLADALTRHFVRDFGQPIRVKLEVGAVTQTAAARDETQNKQRQQHAEQTFLNAPAVKTFIDKYGATVVPGSIKPVENST